MGRFGILTIYVCAFKIARPSRLKSHTQVIAETLTGPLQNITYCQKKHDGTIKGHFKYKSATEVELDIKSIAIYITAHILNINR